MPPARSTSNRTAIAIAVVGITLEVVAIVLLTSKRLTPAVATPLIIAGMFLAFVPIFILARRARHDR